MTENKKICPKCDSDVLTDVGIDKTLMPRILDEKYMVIGDFYNDIHIMQCSNCGCRFLSLEPIGFIKSISTESKSNQKKKYRVGTIGYKSFDGLSGTDKQNAVTNALNEDVNEKPYQEELPKKKSTKKKNDK